MRYLTTSAVALSMLLAACAGDNDAPTLVQQSETSPCGGFASPMSAPTEIVNYCDAEIFYWSYDAAKERLTLTNDRILLNCCGDHSMTVELVDGVYVVTERDAPEDGARCNCMCVFDFEVEVSGVPSGSIALELVRNVTDGSGAELLLEETINLSAGSGSFVIDDEPSEWCQE